MTQPNEDTTVEDTEGSRITYAVVASDDAEAADDTEGSGLVTQTVTGDAEDDTEGNRAVYN